MWEGKYFLLGGPTIFCEGGELYACQHRVDTSVLSLTEVPMLSA